MIRINKKRKVFIFKFKFIKPAAARCGVTEIGDNQRKAPRADCNAVRHVRGTKKKICIGISHINIMSPTSIPRVAMRWTPHRNRRRGRPKETWKRSVGRELKDIGWRWGQVAKLAADRTRWRSLVSALCASTHEGD